MACHTYEETSKLYLRLRWTPHPVIVTTRDNSDHMLHHHYRVGDLFSSGQDSGAIWTARCLMAASAESGLSSCYAALSVEDCAL